MRKLLYLLATVTVSLLMVNCGGLNGPYSTKNLQKVLTGVQNSCNIYIVVADVRQMLESVLIAGRWQR